MKTRLPHIFYLSLLLGSTFYFWQTLHNEKQLRAFLHRPADEMYPVIRENNLHVRDFIQQTLSGLPNETNLRVRARHLQADHLIQMGLAGRVSRDRLRSELDTLAAGEKSVVSLLAQVLPNQKLRRFSPEASPIMAQNDSLRQQLARAHIQNYFAQLGYGCDIKFDPYWPVFSDVTLCPAIGQPFMTDVILSDYPRWVEVEQLLVNGDMLPVYDGVGIFRRTFDAPGDYPLTVDVKALADWLPIDSVVTVEKTFFLHVNR